MLYLVDTVPWYGGINMEEIRRKEDQKTKKNYYLF